ncbi:MAG: cyclodeaminase/cyclohydrolase family protein [Chloroflexota bacterium]
MASEHPAYADLTVGAFTELLASEAPTPGGGSASAIAASLAASLVARVARLSAGRARYAAYAASIAVAGSAADAARVRLLALADADAAAYAAFSAARRMPRDDAAEAAARDAAIAAAAVEAARVPLEIVRACDLLADEIERLAGRSNLHAASDLDVAALLCRAGARGAGANVHVNIPYLTDRAAADAWPREVETRLHAIDATVARIHALVRSGELRSPEDPRSLAG